jgi:dTMP kinase
MPTTRRRGAFITMEGGEGGGKSTQVGALVRRLQVAGTGAIATREPGGSPHAEKIRDVLLAGRLEALGPRAESLLFAAARIDHLDRTIKPALEEGTWVVCDRFHDSTRAYQGAGNGVNPAFIDALERVTLAGFTPDLTFILDVPAAVGLERADTRRGGATVPDRFEKQTLGFHQRLRDAFLELAAREPGRCLVVDATQPIEVVGAAIWMAVRERLDPPGEQPS